MTLKFGNLGHKSHPFRHLVFLRNRKVFEKKSGENPPTIHKKPLKRGIALEPIETVCDNSAMNLKLLKHITIEDGKCGSRPCVRSKRMRVADVLQWLSTGTSSEEIFKDDSFLERQNTLAAY